MTNPLTNAEAYHAFLGGQLAPGSVYPLGDLNPYWQAHQAATAATRGLLGTEPVDFHVIARTDPGVPLYRARWRLHAEYGGPYLLPFTSEPHDTAVDLRLWVRPLTEYRQLAQPPDDATRAEMPYRTVISELYAALILRHTFGTASRQITIGDYGTVTFTPQTLSYRPLNTYHQTSVPIGTSPIAEYQFTQTPDGGPGKALWLALTGAPVGEGWKVSYCTQNPGPASDRWDDPDEPVPAYEPVPFDPPA